MGWVEIIGVRLSPSAKDEIVKKFFSNIRETISSAEDWTAVVYRNAFVESDWTIHLYRDAASLHPEKSRLGLTLAENLKFFGLVNHMIWIEEDI